MQKEFYQVFEEKVVDLEELERKEIVELNKNISQVKDLLLDFSAQVVAQGEMIDRIDFNIVETIRHVDKVRSKTSVLYISEDTIHRFEGLNSASIIQMRCYFFIQIHYKYWLWSCWVTFRETWIW